MYDVVQDGVEHRKGTVEVQACLHGDRSTTTTGYVSVEELDKADVTVYRAHDDDIDLQYR